jgi:hypothetical protein
LDEDWYLCVHDPKGEARRGTKNNFGIILFHAPTQEKLLIHRDLKHSCLSPIPVRARKLPPVIPHMTALGKPLEPGQTFDPKSVQNLPKHGTLGLVNVYDSKFPFPKGSKVKYLRVIQVLPKTTPDHLKPRIGYGAEKPARGILGTVPVEADGSAFFEIPAGLPVYFQALDENKVAIQSMRSATYVQPGERLFCAGCHESRHQAVTMTRTLAMKRAPSQLQPGPEGSRPFSYPRLVQPILEKKCVGCHMKNPKKAPDLRKGNFHKDKDHWYTSYKNLSKYAFFYGPNKRQYDGWQPARTIPGKFGANASKLYKMLKKGHHKVKLTPEEMQRIALWLDSNSDFFGSYKRTKEQAEGKIIKPDLE